jgi:Tol biopolymer transport system component/DNA-binding winged helix-turn-helix (wHTH) protein
MEMGRRIVVSYEFADFCLNTNKRVLLRAGEPVPLTPKAFDTLLMLVRNSGHVVGKDELLNAVWPDAFVEESTLAQNIFTLRKALGQGRDGERYIETVPKYGYRFVASVREVVNENNPVSMRTTTRAQLVNEESGEAAHAPDDRQRAAMQEGVTLVKSNGQKVSDTVASPASLSTRAAALPETYADSPVAAVFKRRRIIAALAIFISFLALAAVVFFTFHLKERLFAGRRASSFERMRIGRLTSTGRAVRAAISPDGKYFASVLKEGALQSLWIRQVDATSSIQIVSPAEVRYQGITFSPDSSAVYYVLYEKTDPVAALYRVPMLGGTANKVLVDIDSAVAFSPDGKRIVFVRNDADGRAGSLIVANIDGTGELKIAMRSTPDFFSVEGPAWSPDGKTIICAVGRVEFNRPRMTVAEVRLEDGVERLITPQQWDSIGQVAWLADGSGILMNGWDSSVSLLSAQIWQLSYTDGKARRITNDLNSYHGVSMTADNSALITVQSDRTANFWVAGDGASNEPTQITSGAGDRIGEALGMSWTPDGRIVYGSTASGGIDVWIMNRDGSNQKQLTTDAQPDMKPSVSPVGGFIVFVSSRSGTSNLWRMDMEGRNLKQLTTGKSESYPNVSPDGRWVVYLSVIQDRPTLWKVSTEGGEPVELNDASVMSPAISPDGKAVACFYQTEQSPNARIALIPLEGGEPVKLFDIPPTVFIRGGVQWTADASALTYIDNRGAVSNIWSQPLEDGHAPTQLTQFTSGGIFRFGWSRDGQRLAFERGTEMKDVIVIRDF